MHITPVHIKYKESLDTILYTVLGDIHLTLNKKWLFNSESLVNLLMFNLMIVIFYRSNGYYFADHFFYRFVKNNFHANSMYKLQGLPIIVNHVWGGFLGWLAC